MNNLPVGRTIVEAYRFVFVHLGTIIGLIWLPIVVATLLTLLPELNGTVPPDAAANPVAASTGAVETLAILVLTKLLYAVVYVAVARQALGLRQGPAIVHFALSLQEFRMFGATLLLMLVVFVGVLGFAMVFMAAATVTEAQSGNIALVILCGLVVAAAGAALIYAIVRISFLVIPVTVVENRVDLVRGFALTGHNFWRIFLVLLAVSAPIVLLEAGALLVLMGKDLMAVLPPVGSSDADIQKHILLLEDVISRHRPESLGVELILAPFDLGLSVSAAVFGYRALAPEVVPALRH